MQHTTNPKDKMVGLSTNEVGVKAASTASQGEICVFFGGNTLVVNRWSLYWVLAFYLCIR